MRREKLNDLIAWKGSKDRKPLILRGARQVGKTWLMMEFGRLYYKNVAYINFEKQRQLRTVFEEGVDIERLIIALQIEVGFTIDPQDTLIILDEIQEAPEAITALKYFNEDASEYHIVAAGSLLGVALHRGISFPVGNVDFLDLNPMSYIEFLEAIGEEGLAKLLISRDWGLITAYKTKYIEKLRYYYFVGGMPESVLKFSENNNFKEVRTIQKAILDAYEHDFSKHAPTDIVPRIRMIWNSVPAQLAKENRKFIYGLVKKGSRAKDYELALSWLIDCRQAYKVHRVSKPSIPLKAYEDPNAFKLFIIDVGLLSALTNMDEHSLLAGNEIFTEFKGALTEQYVFQQLLASESGVVNYWSAEESTAEIDFVLQYMGKVFPLEVKAEENLQAKSLKVFSEKFKPSLKIRTSMSDHRQDDSFLNLPLYALNVWREEVER